MAICSAQAALGIIKSLFASKGWASFFLIPLHVFSFILPCLAQAWGAAVAARGAEPFLIRHTKNLIEGDTLLTKPSNAYNQTESRAGEVRNKHLMYSATHSNGNTRHKPGTRVLVVHGMVSFTINTVSAPNSYIPRRLLLEAAAMKAVGSLHRGESQFRYQLPSRTMIHLRLKPNTKAATRLLTRRGHTEAALSVRISLTRISGIWFVLATSFAHPSIRAQLGLCGTTPLFRR